MQVTIEAPFQMINEKKTYVENQILKLDKYNLNITQANVYYKLGDGTGAENVLAEIRLRIPGNDIFVSQTGDDDVKAFASAYDSLKRQVVKEKDKRQDRQSPVREMTDIVYNTFENKVNPL